MHVKQDEYSVAVWSHDAQSICIFISTTIMCRICTHIENLQNSSPFKMLTETQIMVKQFRIQNHLNIQLAHLSKLHTASNFQLSIVAILHIVVM